MRAVAFRQALAKICGQLGLDFGLIAAIRQLSDIDHACAAHESIDMDTYIVVLAGEGTDRRRPGKPEAIHLLREIAESIELGCPHRHQFLLGLIILAVLLLAQGAMADGADPDWLG